MVNTYSRNKAVSRSFVGLDVLTMWEGMETMGTKNKKACISTLDTLSKLDLLCFDDPDILLAALQLHSAIISYLLRDYEHRLRGKQPVKKVARKNRSTVRSRISKRR